MHSTGAFEPPPCTYLNVGFTNKKEIVIFILVNEKTERFWGDLRLPNHQLRGSRQETNTRLGTVTGQWQLRLFRKRGAPLRSSQRLWGCMHLSKDEGSVGTCSPKCQAVQ